MFDRYKRFIDFLLRTNKLRSFSMFFVLAVMLWFFFQLEKTYQYELVVPVTYNNLPQDVLNVSNNRDTLLIKIKASGYQILKKKFNSNGIVIDYNKLKTNNKRQWFPDENKNLIVYQLGNIQQVYQINPKQVTIKGNEKHKKEVVVKTDVEIDFKQGYKKTSKARIEPEKIWIFGSKEQLRKIDTVYTKKYTLSEIDDSISMELQIILPEKIKASALKISYKLPVDMLIEENVQVKLQAKNVPELYNLVLFPKKVNIKYIVFKKDYKAIDKSKFDVHIDYSKRFIVRNDTFIKPEWNNLPKQIIKHTITPDTIAFLLIK
jgi:YbbR domain-containing protein